MDSKIEPVAWPFTSRPEASLILWQRDFWSSASQRNFNGTCRSISRNWSPPPPSSQPNSEDGRASGSGAKIADDGAEQADRAFRGFTALNAAAFMHGGASGRSRYPQRRVRWRDR